MRFVAQAGLYFVLFSLFGTVAFGQGRCATQPPEAGIVANYFKTLAAAPPVSRDKTLQAIPIAVHVITDGKNGRLTSSQITTLLNNINWAYQDTPFQFYLARVDITKNRSWYSNCLSNAKNQAAMKKRLARDTR